MFNLPLVIVLLVFLITLILVMIDRFAQGYVRFILVLLSAVILCVSLRAIFLDNSLVWPAYSHWLRSQGAITFQQSAHLANRKKHFQPKGDNQEFFALGSSQVNALFKNQDKVFYMHNLGLSLFEYPFFEQEILARHPTKVLLYLSEFDLSERGSIYLYSIKDLPDNMPYLFTLCGRYIPLEARSIHQRINDSLMAIYENIVPEAKYGFIARGILNQWIKLDVLNYVEPKKLEFKSTKDFHTYLRRFAKQRFEERSSGYRQINWEGLDHFISFFERRGTEVVLLEGQYYPFVMTLPEALKANHQFHDELTLVLRDHHNVRFVSRQEQVLLGIQDYGVWDWKHVNKIGAERYNDYLFSKVLTRRR